MVLEQPHGVGDRGLQHVGDAAVFPLHPQRRLVVALAAADFAGDVDVGQEVHLHLAHAVPLAGLAAPAAHVEREPPGLVAVGARLGRLGEDVADGVERLGVGGGVRARRAPDRFLVDVDHLVELLDAGDAAVLADEIVGAQQLAAQGRLQDAADERRLAGARDAGDRHQHAQRESRVDVLEVVLAGALDGQEALRLAARGGDLDPLGARPGTCRSARPDRPSENRASRRRSPVRPGAPRPGRSRPRGRPTRSSRRRARRR